MSKKSDIKIRKNNLPEASTKPASKKEAEDFVAGAEKTRPAKNLPRTFKAITLKFNEYEYLEFMKGVENADMGQLQFLRMAIKNEVRKSKKKPEYLEI